MPAQHLDFEWTILFGGQAKDRLVQYIALFAMQQLVEAGVDRPEATIHIGDRVRHGFAAQGRSCSLPVATRLRIVPLMPGGEIVRSAETGCGRGDAAGLAMTLIHTFGSAALVLVEAQMTASADHPDLAARWCEVREALAVLSDANRHMTAALDLLDTIEEITVPPMLDHAIVYLGLRDGERRADGSVANVGSIYYGEMAQRHLVQAQDCIDPEQKTRHLDAASRYATLRERIIDPRSAER